jgi:hypothetical protein
MSIKLAPQSLHPDRANKYKITSPSLKDIPFLLLLLLSTNLLPHQQIQVTSSGFQPLSR